MQRVLAKLMVLLMMLQALPSICVQATSSNYYSGEKLLYSENFDDWKEGNLLTEAQAVKDKYYMATPAEGKTVNIYSTATNTSSESVVAAVDAKSEGVSDGEHTGKVLKYLNNEKSSSNWVVVKLGLDAKDAPLGDKVTVVEYDMYFAKAGANEQIAETGLPALAYDTNYSDFNHRDSTFNILNDNTFNGCSSPWGQRLNAKQYAVYNRISKPFSADTWHKIKIVYTNVKDPTKDNPDTWRVYCDGTLLNGSLRYGENGAEKGFTSDVYDFMQANYRYNDPSNGYRAATYPDTDNKNVFNGYKFTDKFLGLDLGTNGVKDKSGRPIYFDNISVKTVDNTFDIVDIDANENNFDMASDEVKITFTTPVDSEKLKNVIVKKDGVEVNGAVDTATLNDDGTVLTLKMNPGVLSGKTKYTVNFPATFTDIYGQGLLRYYSATRSLKENEGTNFYNADIPNSSEYEAFEFTTAQMLEYSANPQKVENYEKGNDCSVVLTFANELVYNEGDDVSSWFKVTDENGDTAEGLKAEISEDRKKITLQLSGLDISMGDTYKITSVGGAVNGVDGSKGGVVLTVETLDFKITSDKTVIDDYVVGTEETLVLTSTSPIDENVDINKAFSITDESGAEVDGLRAELSNDNKTITIQLDGVKMHKGIHKIFANDTLLDKYGRTCAWSATVNQRAFYAEYNESDISYNIGSEKNVEIHFSLPLSDECINGIADAFKVTNQYGNTIKGLEASVSDNKRDLSLELGTMDITGGSYLLESVDGKIIAANSDVLTNSIKISITTFEPSVDVDDTGIDPESGAEFSSGVQGITLVSDDFSDYDVGTDLLNGSDSRWNIVKNNSDIFDDDEVVVTSDPKDPTNKVLKIAAGNADANGDLASDGKKYNTVVRKLDNLDEYQINESDVLRLSVSAKIYIPGNGVPGLPTDSNTDPNGYGKDEGYWLSYTCDDNGKIGGSSYAQIRRNTASTPVGRFCFWGKNVDQTSDSMHGFNISSDTWHNLELRYMFVKTDNSQYKLGYEVYLDGEKQFATDTTTGVVPAKEAMFKGMVMRIVTAGVLGTNPVVYYDDLKADVYSKLLTHVNVPKNDVAVNEPIILSFRNRITDYESLAKCVSLYDSHGKTIECDVADVSQDESITQIKLQPKNGNLRWDSKYTIRVKGDINDVYGQSLPEAAYTFSTLKSDGIYMDSENSNLDFDNIDGNQKSTYTLKLSSAAEAKLFAIFAAYSANDTLLDLDVKPIEVGSDTQTLEVISEPNAPVFYRVFLYEADENDKIGKVVQQPHEISTK